MTSFLAAGLLKFTEEMAVLCCVLLALVAAASAQAPLYAENAPTAIDGEYVVILKEDLPEKDVGDHMLVVRNLLSHHGNKNASNIMAEYHIGSFRGYAIRMDQKMRELVRMMPHVKYMEFNQVYTTQQADCDLQASATWGIVRTTERDQPSVNDYSYHKDSGEGVDVYIIDTGIFTQHPDFGGRAKWGADYVNNPSPETDLNGHGTHCAGTVMSNTWGLARKATAIAVRVLNANGSGTTAGVISGVTYTATQGGGKKSVANMSLGGGFSAALNNAVDAAVTAGVSFAVAAGNEGQSACNVSPASAELCATAAASDSSDQIASFSNWGTCVDIIGPGVSITSTWLNGGTNTISGTSMAAPHVAGVMAKYLSAGSYTPAQMKDHIAKEATKDKITGLTGNKATTPNLLIFKECV